MNTTTSRLATLTLSVVAIIILSFLLYKLFTGLGTTLENADCTAQITSHSLIAKLGRKVYLPINCPTTEKHYDASATQEEIRHDIAEEFRLCANRWRLKDGLELFPEEGIYCHYCSYIDFRETNQPLTKLYQYLATKKPKNSKKTYLDLISPELTQDAEQELADVLTRLSLQPGDKTILMQDSYPPNTEYALLHVYAKGDASLKKIKEYLLWRTTVGKLAGASGLALGVVATGVSGVAAITILGTPVGWAIGIGVGAGVLVYSSVQALAYFFTPAAEPEHAQFIFFTPLDKENIKNIGCQYAFATKHRTEGFYTT